MQHDGLWIAATALTLGRKVPVAAAVAQGVIDAEAATASGQVMIRLGLDPSSGIDLARHAVRDALDPSTDVYVRDRVGPVHKLNRPRG